MMLYKLIIIIITDHWVINTYVQVRKWFKHNKVLLYQL